MTRFGPSGELFNNLAISADPPEILYLHQAFGSISINYGSWVTQSACYCTTLSCLALGLPYSQGEFLPVGRRIQLRFLPLSMSDKRPRTPCPPHNISRVHCRAANSPNTKRNIELPFFLHRFRSWFERDWRLLPYP